MALIIVVEDDLLESRLMSRCAGAEVKPWKSYSSLEQMLFVAPSARSRDFEKTAVAAAARRKMAEERQASTSASSQRPRADEELKVVRDERKLSLTIPEEHHYCRVQFAPRGSCQL